MAVGPLLFGMPARGPSRPLLRLIGSVVAAPFVLSTIVRWQEATDRQSRREVVSGPATPRVPTPRLLDDSKEWR